MFKEFCENEEYHLGKVMNSGIAWLVKNKPKTKCRSGKTPKNSQNHSRQNVLRPNGQRAGGR